MGTDTPPADPPLDPIDWDVLDSSDRTIPRRILVFVAGLVTLAILYRYTNDHSVGVFISWEPTLLTWLYRVSLLAVICFGFPPLVRNREQVRQYWRRFRSNTLATISLGYLAVVSVLAIFSPMVFGHPETNIGHFRQPPLFFSVRQGLVTSTCVGPVIDGYCHGTLQHLLGTSTVGQDMVELVLSGLHVSFQVAVITTVLMIPLATTVGLLSGYVGGLVDEVLMRYVDFQQAVPAFFVYIIAVFVFGSSLFLFVVVFGLLNWGSTARLVRSEVLQRRQEQYIEVANSAGVSRLTILRRHVLPNVSNTVIIGAAQKIPQLVLLETALTYIGLGDIGRWSQSFGDTIASGFSPGYTVPTNLWWIWTIPVVVLAVTVIAMSIVGDTLRDVLDPRGDV
ncbi:ABC transporter permease [Haladaptatus sp. NG-SE-30]